MNRLHRMRRVSLRAYLESWRCAHAANRLTHGSDEWREFMFDALPVRDSNGTKLPTFRGGLVVEGMSLAVSRVRQAARFLLRKRGI